MKNKSSILFWTDAALLVLFAALAATGAVMHWVLPPGSGGRPGGHQANKLLLDLSRHQWGQIHFWIASTMIALVVVHLALHWNWIRNCAASQAKRLMDVHHRAARARVVMRTRS
jgi:hypothetical protein